MGKRYSKEFKEEACKLVVKDKIPAKEVAAKFGINPTMIYNWISAYETYGDEAFVGSGNQRTTEAALKKLQKENEMLRMENEILKKAAAYFAKHPKDE